MANNLFLSPTEVRTLSEWKYAVDDKSITTEWFTPMWNYLALLVPSNVAPNVITLAGLLCQIEAWWITHNHSETHPVYAPIMAAILIFLYQTLDAIDGKHARNTKNSSSMGELFDHGCDNISSTFMILTVMSCLGVYSHLNGRILWLMIISFQLISIQFHCESLVTGVCKFGRFSGPGEILMFFELLLLSRPYWTWVEDDQPALPEIMLTTKFWLTIYVCFTVYVCFYASTKMSYGTRNGLFVVLACFSFQAWQLFHSMAEGMSVGMDSDIDHSHSSLHNPNFKTSETAESPEALPLLTIIFQGLSMSVITSDMIVCKMASRDLHPIVVLGCMASTVTPILTPPFVAFYYIKLFHEICTNLQLPLLTPVIRVFVDGVYDLCHAGHKRQLLNALKHGNKLIVGVVSDENVFKYKSKYPVMSMDERIREITELGLADEIIKDTPCPTKLEIQTGSAPILDEAFIMKHKIHLVCHGEEYSERDDVDYYGIPRKMGITRTLPRFEGISTSELVRRARDPDHKKDQKEKQMEKIHEEREHQHESKDSKADHAPTTAVPSPTIKASTGSGKKLKEELSERTIKGSKSPNSSLRQRERSQSVPTGNTWW